MLEMPNFHYSENRAGAAVDLFLREMPEEEVVSTATLWSAQGVTE